MTCAVTLPSSEKLLEDLLEVLPRSELLRLFAIRLCEELEALDEYTDSTAVARSLIVAGRHLHPSKLLHELLNPGELLAVVHLLVNDDYRVLADIMAIIWRHRRAPS